MTITWESVRRAVRYLGRGLWSALSDSACSSTLIAIQRALVLNTVCLRGNWGYSGLPRRMVAAHDADEARDRAHRTARSSSSYVSGSPQSPMRGRSRRPHREHATSSCVACCATSPRLMASFAIYIVCFTLTPYRLVLTGGRGVVPPAADLGFRAQLPAYKRSCPVPSSRVMSASNTRSGRRCAGDLDDVRKRLVHGVALT